MKEEERAPRELLRERARRGVELREGVVARCVWFCASFLAQTKLERRAASGRIHEDAEQVLYIGALRVVMSSNPYLSSATYNPQPS